MNPLVEHHYRVKELVGKMGMSRQSITGLFHDEPGVLKFGTEKRQTLLIPESVYLRVYQRLRNDTFETPLAGNDPLGVMPPGHVGVMTKEARIVRKLHAATKMPNRKSMA
jgi:hypothetical protein